MSDNTTNTNFNSENLVFIQYNLPQMKAGKYEVTTEIIGIKDKSNNDVTGLSPNNETFYVDGPRFSLDPASVYDAYPPQNHYGHAETTLPHILLNRRTLPWERTMHGATSEAPVPWIGLLLLSELELKEDTDAPFKIAQITLGDLTQAKTGYLKPNLTLNPWEKPEQKCQVIDLPTALFKKVAPSWNDLPLLAHVKKADVDKNKETSEMGDNGFFSTLVCNRLPSKNPNDAAKDLRHTVLLVSFEGHEASLKNLSGLNDTDKIRLVVLHSWNFTQAKGKNFRELCETLNVGQFQCEYQGSNQQLKDSLGFGYVPLPHNTRNGMSTYAWYRGPLSPNFGPISPRTRTFESADQALRFDQKAGLFDTSYAAAWQLGRLLALKDKAFSEALFSWKNQYKQLRNALASVNEMKDMLPDTTNDQWKKLLPDQGDQVEGEIFNLEDLVQDFLKNKYQPSVHDQVAKTPNRQPSSPIDTKRPLVPEVAKEWLSRLFLLHGVPFHYLVPHEKLLEEENLANFHLDYAWLECLLDGALSIARTSDSENLMNQIIDGGGLPKNLQDIKREMQGKIPAGDDKPVVLDTITGFMAGFLLRSKIISGWQGVKIFAKGLGQDGNENWLIPLRLEKLSDDVLFCIFDRKVTQVVILQPPESLHFGVENPQGTWSKKLRHWQGQKIGFIDETKKVTVPFREEAYKTLDIQQFSQNIKEKGGQTAVTSSEFAFHMVESPVLYTLKLNF